MIGHRATDKIRDRRLLSTSKRFKQILELNIEWAHVNLNAGKGDQQGCRGFIYVPQE